MEDALGVHLKKHCNGLLMMVLILVLMEDALGEYLELLQAILDNVLILVLMEDALGDIQKRTERSYDRWS